MAYESLSFATRRMLHERLATYIQEAYAGQLPEWYGILAYHFRRAEKPAQEFTYTRLAAEQSARQSAHRQAADFYGRAIELLTRHGLGTAADEADLRIARMWQDNLLGEYERMDEDARSLAALESELDPVRLVRSRVRRGLAALHRGQAQALALYQEAEALARQHGDRQGLLEALHHQGYYYFQCGDYGVGKALMQQVIAEAGECDWQQEVHACRTLGWIAYDEGDMEQCERYWLRELELERTHASKAGEAGTLIALGALYSTLLYVEKGLAHLERGRDLAAQIGYRVYELQGWRMIGEIWMSVGQYERAGEAFQEGLTLSQRFGSIYEGALIRTGLAEVLLATGGDLEQAGRWSREALDAGLGKIGKEGMGWHWHTRGRVLLRQGALQEAQEAFEEAVRLRREVGTPLTGCFTLAELARLHLRRGDMAAARACAGESWPGSTLLGVRPWTGARR